MHITFHSLIAGQGTCEKPQKKRSSFNLHTRAYYLTRRYTLTIPLLHTGSLLHLASICALTYLSTVGISGLRIYMYFTTGIAPS